MKTYKINNHVITASTPEKAVRVAKQLDSIKTRDDKNLYKIEKGENGWTRAEVVRPDGGIDSYNQFYNDAEAKQWVYAKVKHYYGAEKAKEIHDSISDSVPEDVTLDFLISDEREAVEAYQKMIAKTDDPKLLAVLSHILQEETDHIKELENAKKGVFEIKDSIKNYDPLWREGTIRSNNGTYSWWAKVYQDKSDYGIDGGRVSKLTIKRDGKLVANYDRGWDTKPSDPNDIEIMKTILNQYK